MSSLNYLDDNKVIKKEHFDADTNIFIMSNWKAEIDIVKVIYVFKQYTFDLSRI